MNSDLLKYLQQDGIGKVIAKGLADVYTSKPQAPVKYLAAWLKAYSSNQKEIAKLSADQAAKAQKLKQLNARTVQIDKQVAQKKSEESKYAKELEDFENKVKNDHYQKELLFQYVPEFIEKRLSLTGAYVGYVKHPPRHITDEDEDDNAHLDTAQPKMINYIGSSISHAELMHGKTLPLDKGVTGGALSLSLDDPQPNEEGVVEAKDKYIYIPNVVKNENINYFRLPKLGAYIAVPLVYHSYLTEHIFDVALEARQKYLAELQQFQRAKAEALKELLAEAQAAEQKLADAKDKNDEAAIEAAQAEVSEVTKRKKEKEEETFEEEHTELPTEKRQFVVCGDTMGKDCQISESNRQLLVHEVKLFRDSWQKMERELLYKDVNYQVNIEKNRQQTPEAIIQHLEKCIEVIPQVKATFDEIEDETLRQYKKSTWQLQALKKELREGQQYLAAFFKLKNFRVVKFRSLVQTLLYFLRYEKSTINQQNKNRLDWKKVRANYLYADTFYAVINYISEGPKAQDYPFYCKINHILEKLEKYSETEVYQYNIGLGALLTLVKRQIAHRIANIELRRGIKEKERKQRADLLEENEKISEEKRQALEKHKQSLSGQDLESFKEEQWSAKYDEENPLKEIPPEVVDDIDNDF